jgi:hypothetical protein
MFFYLSPHPFAARKTSDNIIGLRSQENKKTAKHTWSKKVKFSPHIGYCSRQFIVRIFKGTESRDRIQIF